MSDWRANPNLVECYENCVAMFHSMPVHRPDKSTSGAVIRKRRIALGLSQRQLGLEAGYRPTTAGSSVGYVEREIWTAEHTPIPATLDRLEAERARVAAE